MHSPLTHNFHASRASPAVHEQISELKGNIRVFCRVRPPSASESSLVKVKADQLEPTHMELAAPSDASSSLPKFAKFKFDRVFAEGTSQADVFKEVAQLTQSALDGHKVSAHNLTQSHTRSPTASHFFPPPPRMMILACLPIACLHGLH